MKHFFLVEPLLDGRSSLNSGVDVPVVEFLVQNEEQLILLNEGSDLLRIWKQFDFYFQKNL